MKKTFKVNRKRAIEIAMNHNNVSYEVASRYTDCELKEILKHLSGSSFIIQPTAENH